MNISSNRILIAGASSDIATSLIKSLYKSKAIIGLHYNKNALALSRYTENERAKKFQKNLSSALACHQLVSEFSKWAGGIDCLIQMTGDINRNCDWRNLTEEEWFSDLSVNLVMPFFLAQKAISNMSDGGRIILMSTASAIHGGGSNSLAYGAAKAGMECVAKRLAKDCAGRNILVNAIAPGFIMTKFHTEKLKKTKLQLEERAELVPLKRAGTPEDIAGVILFLLSEASKYITGQVISVSGGDWL